MFDIDVIEYGYKNHNKLAGTMRTSIPSDTECICRSA